LRSLTNGNLQNKRLRRITNGLWVYKHPYWGVDSRWPVLKQLGFRLRISAIYRSLKRLQMKCPILWIVDPRFGNIIKYFKRSLVCYHVVDNYTAAPYFSEETRANIAKAEKFMLSVADLVIVTSPFLLEEKSKYNNNVHLVRNAVDYEQFTAINDFDKVPEDMKNIPKPIIGYIGAINEKLDYELLNSIARARPQWSFVFVGSFSKKPGSPACQFAYEHPHNVFLLGQRAVTDVPHYIHACNICILPYRRDDYTEAIDSLKLYEYFACGKPVVATDIPAVREHSQVVYIAEDANDFMHKIEKAMISPSPKQRDLQRAIAMQNTWEKRVEQLSFLIRAASLQKSKHCILTKI